MAGPVLIPANTMTQVDTESLLSSGGKGGFAGAFATLLAGLLQSAGDLDLGVGVPVEIRPVELPMLQPEGPKTMAELAINPAKAGNDNALVAEAPVLVTALLDSKTEPGLAHQVSKITAMAPVAAKATEPPTETDAVKVLDAIKAPNVEKFSVTDEVADVIKPPSTVDVLEAVEDPDAVEVKVPDPVEVPDPMEVPVAAKVLDTDVAPDTDKIADGAEKITHRSARAHVNASPNSNQDGVPIALPPVCQAAPDPTLTAFALSSPMAQVSSTQSVQTPIPAPDASLAPVSRVMESGSKKDAEPHHIVAQSSRTAQPVRSALLGTPVTPVATSWIEDKPEEIAVGSNAVSEAAALVTHPDISLNLPSRAELAPPPTLGQDHAAAPVDRSAPAEQVAPALVGILKSTDGTQSVTVRLQPPELGHVEIRVDRTSEGSARVDITAERPETLQLLQRDEPRLQQILDQAGVGSNGRSFSFQVAAPEQVGASASRPDSMAAGSGDSGQGQSGGAWRQSEDSRRDPNPDQGSNQGQTRARWFRAGLDITA